MTLASAKCEILVKLRAFMYIHDVWRGQNERNDVGYSIVTRSLNIWLAVVAGGDIKGAFMVRDRVDLCLRFCTYLHICK